MSCGRALVPLGRFGKNRTFLRYRFYLNLIFLLFFPPFSLICSLFLCMRVLDWGCWARCFDWRLKRSLFLSSPSWNFLNFKFGGDSGLEFNFFMRNLWEGWPCSHSKYHGGTMMGKLWWNWVESWECYMAWEFERGCKT